MTVKTRFAPSPTGFLHIGGARTALFNWLYARNRSGRFVLRIEDTDRERSTGESVREILESLKWLGLDWDEGPYFQSQRSEIYARCVEKLLAEGKAYRCYCTKEELDRKREEMEKAGRKPMYDGKCRNIEGGDPSRPHVVRFKMPLAGATSFTDTLRGAVETPNAELDDLVIRRTDGSVIYNFVVVVDDAEMGITHVIRGDDHLANTPKQVNLYRGLGYAVPQFTHVSLILGKDKKRLSKRHGAVSVLAYREMGYLPDAMVNMLARLGWGHGDKEVFSRGEMVALFSLEKITMSHAVFDQEKLDWLNAQHMKRLPDAELAALAFPFVAAKYPRAKPADVERLVPLVRERSRTLVEMADGMDFFFAEKIVCGEEERAKFLTPQNRGMLSRAAELLEKTEPDPAKLNAAFKALAEELSLKLKDVAQPVRVALTGKTVSPGVFEMMAVLGAEESIKRIRAAAENV